MVLVNYGHGMAMRLLLRFSFSENIFAAKGDVLYPFFLNYKGACLFSDSSERLSGVLMVFLKRQLSGNIRSIGLIIRCHLGLCMAGRKGKYNYEKQVFRSGYERFV